MRVLFVGGFGRSGSTLVERLLGQLPGICPLGEVVHLWQRGLLANEQCGCGAAFHDCPFWREVGERAFGGWGTLDVARVRALKSAVDRTRFVPLLASPRIPRRISGAASAYRELYRRVYQAAAEVSGCRLVIDSSKHASLAFCLRQSSGIELRVLHLVRDSRGVAYSWMKRVRRPEGAEGGAYMARLSPLRATVRWTAQNAAFDLLSNLGTPVRRIRYEDVVARPAATLCDIAGFAGIDAGGAALSFLQGHEARFTTDHTVSGNPTRFHTGPVTLRGDDEWRSRLPAPTRNVVTALTAPALVRYGYVPRRGEPG